MQSPGALHGWPKPARVSASEAAIIASAGCASSWPAVWLDAQPTISAHSVSAATRAAAERTNSMAPLRGASCREMRLDTIAFIRREGRSDRHADGGRAVPGAAGGGGFA